jgi:hypothetical protein
MEILSTELPKVTKQLSDSESQAEKSSMAQSITHGNSSGIFKNKKKKTKVQSENH